MTQFIAKKLKLSLLVGACVLLGNQGAIAGSTSMLDSNKPNAEYLFVESADKVYIKVDNSKDGTYTITLKNVDPLVTYFSDRPIRNAGELTVDKFLEIWQNDSNDSFKKNPPNAVLHAKKGDLFTDEHVFNFAIELSNPVYNKKERSLTFVAKPLPGNIDPMPNSITLHHVSLFIDSVCLTCWGGN